MPPAKCIWMKYGSAMPTDKHFADNNKINVGKIHNSFRQRLYGNGGIMPDIFVGMDTRRASRDINKLYFNGSFNDFVFRII